MDCDYLGSAFDGKGKVAQNRLGSLGSSVDNEAADCLYSPKMSMVRACQASGKLDTHGRKSERPFHSKDNEQQFQTRKGRISRKEKHIYGERRVDVRSHVQRPRYGMQMEGSEAIKSIEVWRPRSFNQPREKRETKMDYQYDKKKDKGQISYQSKEKIHETWGEKTKERKKNVCERNSQFKSLQQNQYIKRRDSLYEGQKHDEMIQYGHEEKVDNNFDLRSKDYLHKRKFHCSKCTLSKSQDGEKVCKDRLRNHAQQELQRDEYCNEIRKDCFHLNTDHRDYSRLRDNLYRTKLTNVAVDGSSNGVKTMYHHDETIEQSMQDLVCDMKILTGNQSEFVREFGIDQSVSQVDGVSTIGSKKPVCHYPSEVKPLKSILKKKKDTAFEITSTDSGCDRVRLTEKKEKDFDENNSNFQILLQKKEGNMKLSLQTDLNVDDEEEYLYGLRKSETKLSNKDQEKPNSSMATLYNSSQRDISEVQESVEKTLSPTITNLPSWMKPLIEVKDVTDRGKDSLDQTVQDILKSIGFNFDLSKRMQELAKIKKQNEEESQFSINKSASFLGSVIPGMSFSAKLTKNNETSEESTNVISEGVFEESVSGKILVHENSETFSRHCLERNCSLEGLQNSNRHASTSNMLRGTFEEFLSNDEANVKEQQTSRSEDICPKLAHSFQSCYAYPSELKDENTEGYMPKWYASSFIESDEFKSDKQNIKAFPLSEETEISNLEVLKQISLSRKRQREESPEYSRIVLAPKIREKQAEIPCKRNKEIRHKMEDRKDKQSENNNSNEDTLQVPIKNQNQIFKETEEREKKLNVLERELGKLKKHQNEIMRRRQRQKDGHKDPLLLQNSKLQEEISAQIKLLRKPTDQKDMSTVKDLPETGRITQGETSGKWQTFSDPGSHWCFDCNHVSETLFDYLNHLQSRKHRQMDKKLNRGWTGNLQQKTSILSKIDSKETTLIKGVEFMKSTDAFYCSLCDVFTGDLHSAEDHLTSRQHFEEYRIHTEQNEFYEKRYALEKTAALSRVKKKVETSNLPMNDVQIEIQEQVSETILDSYPSKGEVPPEQDGQGNVHYSEFLTEHENKMSLKSLPEKAFPEKNSENFAVKYLKTEESKSEQKLEKRSIENSKQEETSKGKIAIKLTGKTVIKPHVNILPVWTPLASKSVATLPKMKEVESSVTSVAKSEMNNPSSLDSFLSIAGLTTKKLPIYKLKPGVLRKPICHSLGPAADNDMHENTPPEEKADLKLLGIDTDIAEIALKRKPPPRSQNVCLPKHITSKSSSSAEQLYSVFFQGPVHVNETSCQLIDLDDIPIPPPPPLPPLSSQPRCHQNKSDAFENMHTKFHKDETINSVPKLQDDISKMNGEEEVHNSCNDTDNVLESCPRTALDMREPGDKTMHKGIDEERDEENKSLTINHVSLKSEGLLYPDQMALQAAESEDEESIHMESDLEVVDEYTAE